MNRADYRARLREWAKGTNLSDEQLDVFIDGALGDLEWLRTPDQEITITINMTDSRAQLPTDFLAVRELASDTGRQRTVLRQAGQQALARFANQFPFSNNGDSVRLYGVSGFTLYVPQSGNSSLELTYYRRPAFPDDSTPEPVAARYPTPFIYAGLMQLYQFRGDWDGALQAQRMLDTARDVIDTAGELSRHGAAGGPM